MPRLTTYDKRVILRAIFADVPEPDDEEIKAGAQAALVKAMSPECRRLYRKAPKALNTDYVHGIANHRSFNLIVADLTEEQIDAAVAPWREARERYDNAKAQLCTLISSCSTSKQFEDRLPEFVSYLPKEGQPTANLPAGPNLVADLVKLGWTGVRP